MDTYDSQNQANDKYSLRGRVFNKIREDILSGKYEKNEELKEMAIGAELGVSRTPVREALRQLELEGLVKIIPNKGAYVIGITLKDVKDIYEIRSLLEGLCARWATENADEKTIAQLEEILELAEFYEDKDNTEQNIELDNKFHDIIYNIANSKMLKHTLTDYHHYLERMRKMTLSSKERVKHSNMEHRAIVEAMKSSDSAKAERLANQHIMSTMKNIESLGLWEGLK